MFHAMLASILLMALTLVLHALLGRLARLNLQHLACLVGVQVTLIRRVLALHLQMSIVSIVPKTL